MYASEEREIINISKNISSNITPLIMTAGSEPRLLGTVFEVIISLHTVRWLPVRHSSCLLVGHYSLSNDPATDIKQYCYWAKETKQGN